MLWKKNDLSPRGDNGRHEGLVKRDEGQLRSGGHLSRKDGNCQSTEGVVWGLASSRGAPLTAEETDPG
jgi:hypothetical protein